MRASVFITLFWLTILPTAAVAAVKDPRITVDMTTLGRPEYAPLPTYPKEARRHSWGGFAIYEVHCKFDGTVGYVFVRLSTGHPILDEAGKAALAQWRWHGGRFRLFAVPMTFDRGTPPARPSPTRTREQPKTFESAKEKGLTYVPRPFIR
jgi:TonB family protein